MIKYCFAYFNKLGDFYDLPFFADQKDEFVKVLTQVLYSVKKEELESLKERDLYYLGSFDNESGVIEPKKEFVVSMSGIVSVILVKRFGEQDHGQA